MLIWTGIIFIKPERGMMNYCICKLSPQKHSRLIVVLNLEGKWALLQFVFFSLLFFFFLTYLSSHSYHLSFSTFCFLLLCYSVGYILCSILDWIKVVWKQWCGGDVGFTIGLGGCVKQLLSIAPLKLATKLFSWQNLWNLKGKHSVRDHWSHVCQWQCAFSRMGRQAEQGDTTR